MHFSPFARVWAARAYHLLSLLCSVPPSFLFAASHSNMPPITLLSTVTASQLLTSLLFIHKTRTRTNSMSTSNKSSIKATIPVALLHPFSLSKHLSTNPLIVRGGVCGHVAVAKALLLFSSFGIFFHLFLQSSVPYCGRSACAKPREQKGGQCSS